jgi:hypothetical protein
MVLARTGNLLPKTRSQAKEIIEIDMAALLSVNMPDRVRSATQKLKAKGNGSLEESRGSDHLTRDGVVLRGERDIFGAKFNAKSMATLEEGLASWSGGVWNGNTWSGNTWSGNTWSGNTWSGNTWSGNTWSGNTWSGNTWSGNTWSGNTWSGSSLSGNTWSGNTWSTDAWR